jgi:hypothetical protein
MIMDMGMGMGMNMGMSMDMGAVTFFENGNGMSTFTLMPIHASVSISKSMVHAHVRAHAHARVHVRAHARVHARAHARTHVHPHPIPHLRNPFRLGTNSENGRFYVSMKIQRTLTGLIGLLSIAACSESPTQPNEQTSKTQTAYVEWINNKPALFIQNSTDASPRQIHFDGTAEDLPNHDPLVPKLADANILALRSPRWSPDGTRLAFVATTAFDQAEVVVIDADGTHPRIVSVNTQYVISNLDWSPDGKQLAYAMSTRAAAQGLELFVSDVDNKTFRQLTQASGFSGLGGVIRFNATGTHVMFSKKTGEQPTAPFNYISDIRRVSAQGGAVETLNSGIVGEVQAIERSGAGILLMKNTAWPASGDIPRELSRTSLTGSAPRVLASSTALQYASLTDDDAQAVLLTQTSGSFAFQSMPTMGGTPSVLKTVTDGTGGLDIRFSK